MRIALINSGLGLLAAATEVHRRRPDADLILTMDPDAMPWGPRSSQDIVLRSLLCARAAAGYQPDVLVMACNTGSVHALDALRAEFEPAIPVVGTVPAIKPAAAAHRAVAIWATAATTNSAYQRRLIAEFAAAGQVTPVACPGLADAIDAGDAEEVAAAVAAAATRTPGNCEAVVLGCTEYELAAEQISKALGGITAYGSAPAVAAQALRRALPAAENAAADRQYGAGGNAGTVRVLLSGRPAALPAAALGYPEGRLLGRLAVEPGGAVPGAASTDPGPTVLQSAVPAAESS